MSKLGAVLITVFLGEFGVHRFMTGHILLGILYLLTGGIFGIGWIIDIVKVVRGTYTKKDGTPWVVEE